MDIHKIGKNAEYQARVFLEKNGLKLLSANYRCKLGEIDLIMLDQNEIVFIEVRKRSHSTFGLPIETINFHKQRKIIKTATYYLQTKDWLDKVSCRFDVIGISQNQLEWIKDAFSENY